MGAGALGGALGGASGAGTVKADAAGTLGRRSLGFGASLGELVVWKGNTDEALNAAKRLRAAAGSSATCGVGLKGSTALVEGGKSGISVFPIFALPPVGEAGGGGAGAGRENAGDAFDAGGVGGSGVGLGFGMGRAWMAVTSSSSERKFGRLDDGGRKGKGDASAGRHGRSTTVLLRRPWMDSRDVAAELQMARLLAASKAQEDEMEVPDRCLVSRCAVGAS
jgi:hypothetical protein